LRDAVRDRRGLESYEELHVSKNISKEDVEAWTRVDK